MSTKFPMTNQGAERLALELEDLKKVQRPRIENAEYSAAREQQSFCEGRIQEIEGKLSNAQIIDVTKIPHTGKVIFGTTVTIINLDTDQSVTYQIVGDDEADVKANKISVNSPIARALVGKEEGDVVVVRAPGGDVDYEIDKVEHI
jgi:transcription elongation factor GreA